MAEKRCPDCETNMVKNRNGTYTCPKCGAVFIPSGCTGVFFPASIIGIN